MRSKKTSPTTQNQTFVARSQQALDDNIHDIDGDTRRELRSIREQALANPARKSLFSGSRAAVALAIASAAIVLIPVSRFQTADITPQTLPHADDFELLQSNETFELLSNLEMYQWMMLEDPAVKS
ncbi:MAG: DUF3619 family protein [Pseudomonadales bacterium]|nr:DUF3619 family protein [Pseudomonadales bacterium]